MIMPQQNNFNLPRQFISCAERVGLDVKLAGTCSLDLWQQVACQIGYMCIEYDYRFIQFHHLYFIDRSHVHDLTAILYHDKKPVAIWPIFALQDRSPPYTIRLGSNLGPLLSPLFVDHLAQSIRSRLEKSAVKAVVDFCQSIGVSSLVHQENIGPVTGHTSTFHKEMMRAGSTANPAYLLYVDLSLSLEEIRSDYRKSYKSLINAGEKMWSVNTLSNSNAVIWEEFRQLHIQVAGRETRSAATWTMQHDCIVSGSGFLVYLRNAAGRMVGGGFFQHTGQEGLYLVGAYDRDLFDKPLGHIVQHTAIVEMKRRGLLWHKLGQRFYAGCSVPGTAKEQSISTFKEGFATHQFVRLDSELRLVHLAD